MTSYKKIVVFLFLGIVLALSALCVYYAQRCSYLEATHDAQKYKDRITELQESINKLVVVVDNAKQVAQSLERDKDELRKQVQQILSDYDKGNSAILDGGIDDNIRILSEFLSEEIDTEPNGHGYRDNPGTASKNKSRPE